MLYVNLFIHLFYVIYIYDNNHFKYFVLTCIYVCNVFIRYTLDIKHHECTILPPSMLTIILNVLLY